MAETFDSLLMDDDDTATGDAVDGTGFDDNAAAAVSCAF
jgi:hypothetical protein